MGNSIPAYRRNLDGLTVLLVAAQGVLPLVLGYALAGWELATVFVVAVTLVGLWRTGGTGALPGTYRLAPHQAPGLFHLVNSLAGQAGLRRRPELRIVPGGQTNAAATLNGNTPVLVVTEALLSRLDSRRLAAVLAHEVAHLAHGDLVLFRLAHSYQAATVVLGTLTVVLALVTVAFAPAVSLFWAVVAALAPAASRFLVAALSRTREFAADLGASRLTGDPGALADALEFIDYRPRTLWDWLTGSRSPVPDPASNAFRTHPPTVERVRRLDRMARFSD
jgi:heat shock protein HtpX